MRTLFSPTQAPRGWFGEMRLWQLEVGTSSCVSFWRMARMKRDGVKGGREMRTGFEFGCGEEDVKVGIASVRRQFVVLSGVW
mmetsp:Transcript_5139/g.10886  ORF Transcript_5139/g.10886 Transcript_5139/m.10886 type:complete len:82 (-) Transcript_5139:44-289(-)